MTFVSRGLRGLGSACALGLRLLGSCLFALGCATTHVTQPQHVTLVPQQAAAAQYTSEASSTPIATGDLREAAQQNLADARKQGAPALIVDDRLALLARDAADYWETYGESPNHAVLDFLAHHLGLPEPAPHLALMKSPAGDIAAHIAEEIVQLTARGNYTHVGVFAERSGFMARAVVVLSFRHLRLEPLPRAVELGATLSLQGELDKGYTTPTLVLVSPDGQSQRETLGKARAFSSSHTLDQRGEYRVELLGEGEQGVIVVANFPVYVGVAPPGHVEISSTSSQELSPDALAQRLRELANADRQKLGLSLLQDDEALAAVAHAHNQDMIDHGFVGHTSPTTGTAAERVQRAGLPSSLVLENIGRDYSAEELEQGWMSSPGHRANLLHPQATHVGIDARVLPSTDDGPPQILATEVFIRRTPPLPKDPVESLLEALNEAREQAGVPAVDLNTTLSSSCQQAAERVFGKAQISTSRLFSELQRAQMNRAAPGTKLASTMVFTTDLLEVAKMTQLHDKEIAAVALGIAQGRRPEASDDEIAVVISLIYR